MMRALVLTIALLTMTTAPAYARGHGHGGSARHVASGAHGSAGFSAARHFDGHRGPVVIAHPRFHHAPFRTFVPAFGLGYYVPGVAYGPNCWWQEGYWINQPYVDRYGTVTYVPQRVPGQWVCQ